MFAVVRTGGKQYRVTAGDKGGTFLDTVFPLHQVLGRRATLQYRPATRELRHIRLFIGITTSGSPWWWLKLIGDPGRSLFMKGLRPLYAPRCRMRWLQLFNMNHVTVADREAFLARVRRELLALRP